MNLITTTGNVLSQLDDVIVQLKPEDYSRPVKLLNNSTIGQHVRHTLEFFICLMDGTPSGVVNYDNRRRDKMIEDDMDFARQVLRSIGDFVKSHKENSALNLEADFGSTDRQADREAMVSIPSNYLRELVYNIEHAIHHMALIRVAINEFCSYVQLPEDFGVASSTIRSRQASN
ncbi:DinB family protein [Imperialibacter roseus]|uniref:DinB family protein n=1 Tax=Imperialibacter roseus TaxID=1324217 RepID=A0ABZ0IMD6_9BACT|nr:DinB family protein [Imperialibacter roseus]WOK05866.1 DinB family protein [Imperialibacter roseus]|tara:strand:- start:28523 stop:29044 length:522 start_codon:yes stop_codon:yes gene_type:complete